MTRLTLLMEATIGGTREHLRQLTENLDQSRFQVTVICSNLRTSDFDADIEAMKVLGIEVVILPMRREVDPARDFAQVVWLVRYFLRHPCDVVHTHSSKAGLLGRIAAAIAGVPRVIHTPHTLAFQATGCSRFQKWMYRIMERFAGEFTDILIALSEKQKERFVFEGLKHESKIEVIYNGVAIPQPDSGLSAELRTDLGISETEKVVGFVGRLTEQKGLHELLQIANTVCAKNPQVTFLLLGEGGQRRRLQTELEALGLEGRVRLLGHREDIMPFYQIFDLLLMTSHYEGLPYAVLESMSAGTPVVAFELPELRPAIIDGVTGMLIPFGDCAKVAVTVSCLLDDEETRKVMGSNARKRIQESFTTDFCVAAHEKIYRT
ncbi:MAG: glycosyltransferase family 4 protein [Planctomycetota bacterium]|nr:glycosyltransferase family 4 protein [Planctomycetota bacterium]MDA1137540.1 glycosyltransferase family 4 protein [Planctomycetota bacterium]